MDYNFEKLKMEFEAILKMGWIKSDMIGSSGAGILFEKLLGKMVDNLEVPDYHGIEVKTMYATKYLYVSLFNATPDSFLFEIKRIHEKYGYCDKANIDYKVFNASIYGNKSRVVSGMYAMKLIVDRLSKKIVFKIYDQRELVTDSLTSWSFDLIQEKLIRKLKYLLFVKVERKWNNGVYYRYTDATLFKLKGFDTFLELIESGDIRVTFKISVFRHGSRISQVHDHGTSFDIHEDSLNKLFDVIYKLG